jgi:SAM-dependent methyltransferase
LRLGRPPILQRVASYYSGCLREHGETARGVDWNSTEAQELRFRELLRILPEDATGFSILDYGCGYGALVDVLSARGAPFRYLGYDISHEMVDRARRRHEGRPECVFGTGLETLGIADFAVASGVLNVKLDIPVGEWHEHVARCLEELHAVSSRGFAFNALTTYSDPDRMIEQLFYADPAETFDYCKSHFSRNVALLHDYGLYEFTVLVRKHEP